MPGTFSPAFLFWGGRLKELSLFFDESGSDGLDGRYYLLTLVAHEQADDIDEGIKLYCQALSRQNLPDIPFHASPLMNGKDAYRTISLADRKRLFSSFRVFFRHAPVRYHCMSQDMAKVKDREQAGANMRRKLIEFLFDHLAWFQSFDTVKIYYDNGQQSMAEAIHRAIGYALSKEAVIYRTASPENYRLAQIADYLCTVELISLKYEDGAQTNTDRKFFGSGRDFRKGVLKEARRKIL